MMINESRAAFYSEELKKCREMQNLIKKFLLEHDKRYEYKLFIKKQSGRALDSTNFKASVLNNNEMLTINNNVMKELEKIETNVGYDNSNLMMMKKKYTFMKLKEFIEIDRELIRSIDKSNYPFVKKFQNEVIKKELTILLDEVNSVYNFLIHDRSE